MEPAARLELHVSCRDLRSSHLLDSPNCLVVLYCQVLETSSYHELGRSEVIKHSSNPDFVSAFNVDYAFETCQKLTFEIYNVERRNVNLDKQEVLGTMECNVGEIVSAPAAKLLRPLLIKSKGHVKKHGQIIVTAEEMSKSNDIVCLHFSATNLDKKDFMGKSDPFLVIQKQAESGEMSSCSWIPVHKTEVVKKTLNPSWRPFSLKVFTLCGGNFDRPLKVECYDWDSDGRHDFIGSFTTTLNELIECSRGRKSFECINEAKKHKKYYKNSGIITLFKCSITPQHSFLDYIRGGCQLGFTVAIDFTASNGRPTLPTSLHYINPYEPNPYSLALRAIGKIIQDYDSDKLFPAFGFGARVSPSKAVSHEFALNGDVQNPYCAGIDGVLEAYEGCLQRVHLDGPTNFAPIINHVAKFAEKQHGSGLQYVTQTYSIC